MPDELKGFNAWTLPWQPPDPGALDAATAVTDYEAALSDIDIFRRDGVVRLKGPFTDWVEPLRAGLDRNLAEPGAYAFPCESIEAAEPGRFFDRYCNWPRIPEYRDYLLTSCAASMAGQFMGAAQAQLFHEHSFAKEPGTQRATPWHQDLPYYSVDGQQTVSIYVSLDSATAAPVRQRRRAFSSRWLGDDVRYCERPGETSPPFPDIGLAPGDAMREDWFPVLWRRP